MTATISRLTDRQAPCGKVGSVEVLTDEDQQGLVSEERRFGCGCRSNREEYHDGSVEHRVVRHDRRVLDDGHDGEHLA